MQDKSLAWPKRIFYAQIVIFLLIVAHFTALPASMQRPFFPVATVLALVFFILGAGLIVFAGKSKARKKLKIFMIMTGASSAGVLLGSILHNVVYAIFIVLFGHGVWNTLGMADEPFFFIFALILCPAVFLVGAIGTIILLIKKNNS